jgi:hypothetical protein
MNDLADANYESGRNKRNTLTENIGRGGLGKKTPRRSPRENQMTAITDIGPGQLIRWHYLGYAAVALKPIY